MHTHNQKVPVFEMLRSWRKPHCCACHCHQGHHDYHDGHICDTHVHDCPSRSHKILYDNVPFSVGDFVFWDSVNNTYVLARENQCDLMVTRVSRSKKWFEAAKFGEFKLKDSNIQGRLYIDENGAMTSTRTNTEVGFIDQGWLYLSV